MTLSPGTRLGHYEILSAIGAGGMGEVYRARDTKLGRQVALKVLPEAFATDSERLAPFKREAQVLASLNHPNIAAIYGLEEADGLRPLSPVFGEPGRRSTSVVRLVSATEWCRQTGDGSPTIPTVQGHMKSTFGRLRTVLWGSGKSLQPGERSQRGDQAARSSSSSEGTAR
jgi:serine/threonine protein kinase